ncbi:DUF4349 domain-containing protein [Paenibacillus sp. SI8]|uniref:DUF4349 domain-containing protein n=1 Tax=unclassified Paenibacillus TaxID=185978 RepID=UPI0034664972
MGSSQRKSYPGKTIYTRFKRKGAFRGKQNQRSAGWMLAAALLLVFVISGCGASEADSKAPKLSKDKAASQPSGNAQVENSMAVEQKAASVEVAPRADATSDSMKKQAVTAAAASDKTVPITVIPATGSDEAAGFNRKLIYQANLVMPVEDYGKAQTELRNLVALSGAYILQFSENASTGERGGTYTIKVAANGFVSLLDGLEKISPSLQRNIQGQDVTEEYVDLESRLKAKQLVETRLLGFMDKASKTDDLLAFSNELSKVQGEIEQIKGRMRYLDQNVTYSTIELRMYQQTGNKPLLSDPSKITLEDRITRAWNSSLNVLAAVLQGILVFLAAALPVLVLAAIIIVPIWVFRRKRNKYLLETRNQLKAQNAALNALQDEAQGTKDGQ